ncbi:uncharacterized protein Dvar_29460 [Desulfosarcina variabilis str. Montpellier]|uniref:hypothetical protein n=1 Tax=Desulfosarcina variabilis TaxID=2300 RepID=UPI003AFA9973
MKPSAANETVRAIIDASSAILLYKAGLLDAYCRMIQLLMTRSVFAEVTVPQQCGADAIGHLSGQRPGIVVLDDPRHPDCHESVADIGRLHRGERDTLLHYLNGAARFVVIDDGKAVRVCRRQDIPHINALLVPKLLYFAQRLSMDQIDHYFFRLCSLGRYSDKVVDWAKRCGASQLEFFLRQ